MTALEDTVNIGPVLAEELRSVGISDFAELAEVGAFQATRMLEAAGKHNCTNAYLALEGATRGVRWMSMPKMLRTQLAERWRSRDWPSAT